MKCMSRVLSYKPVTFDNYISSTMIFRSLWWLPFKGKCGEDQRQQGLETFELAIPSKITVNSSMKRKCITLNKISQSEISSKGGLLVYIKVWNYKIQIHVNI